jgi:hypothetical protein
MIYTKCMSDSLIALPDDMIALVYQSLEQRRNVVSFSEPTWEYEYMDVVHDLKIWLNRNIIAKPTWSVQTLRGAIPQHKDWAHDELKLNFLVDPGNPDTTTVWYSDTGELLYEAHLVPRTWNSLAVNVNHTVTKLSMDQLRISIVQGDER